ncbi:MAG: sulfite exporter TauE/SafE family protein [Pseudomonadota bacterium]
MDTLLIAVVACAASLLTFFSGFGLGTLLLPAFALYFPVEAAVMMTAVVHLANNLFKLGLMYRHVERSVVLRFGLPALIAAWFGAALLIRLSQHPALVQYQLLGRSAEITWTGLVVGALMLAFALRELLAPSVRAGVQPKWLPLGGLMSGFFGGLSGHQGALRSAFLIGCGMSKETFVATGVTIACLVDVSRLSHYLPSMHTLNDRATLLPMLVAVGAAFLGALAGRRLLQKVTLAFLHRMVGVLLLIVGAALMAGVL